MRGLSLGIEMINDLDNRFNEMICELEELIKRICQIPSPTHREGEKAVFINQWLHSIGANSYIDDMNNVIFEYGNIDVPLVVFVAHIDTVYSPDTQLTIFEDEDIIKCPGVNDNSSNVAGLMIGINYFLKQIIKSRLFVPKHRLCFVFSTCEEALGNSAGFRFFLSKHQNIKEVVVLDGDYSSILSDAVGSERYNISISTIGGHSFREYKKISAVHVLAKIICDLYCIDVPFDDSHTITTFNAGVVSGGTSVTTIASFAQIQCEYRSNRYSNLSYMRNKLFEVIGKYKSNECTIEVELIGSRPCSFGVDETKQEKLLNRIEKIYTSILEKSVPRRPRSTDGSISLSMGIPTTSISIYLGKGNHSESQETLFKDSLPNGMNVLFCLIESYCA